MALTPEQQQRLTAIDALLARGVSSATTDNGRRVDYDLNALRRERDELRALAVVAKVGSRFRRAVLTDG
jgi:hypothetical protein